MALVETCIFLIFQTLCQFIATLHIYYLQNLFIFLARFFLVICNVLQKDIR